jgi:DNA-binding NarL/FixJ family response regulator
MPYMTNWRDEFTVAGPGASLLPIDEWERLGSNLGLSRRELQVVQGVFEDHKEENIAFTLGISPHTVNTYMQRVYSKLGVSSRPQLIVRIVSIYLET